MDRKDIIGSSDIAAVMGLSRFKSPLQLWAEKTGQLPELDLSEVEAVEWGTRLEEVVAQKYAQKHNVKLMAYKKRFTHPDYPYMSCELDRIIVGTDEAVEVKTCGVWRAKEWAGEEIPQEYILQHIWALGLSKRQKGNFAVLIGGQKYVEKTGIAFDRKLFDDMVAAARRFMEHNIKKNIPPVAVGMDNEVLVELHPESGDDLIQATAELETAIAHRLELAMHIGEMIKDKNDIDAKIKQVIGDNAGLKTEKYKVTWKTQISHRINNDLLKEDGLYDKYLKEGQTRVLRVTKNKEV